MSERHVEVLKLARNIIDKKQDDFICFAVSCVIARDLTHNDHEGRQIKRWIEDQLYPKMSYGGWLGSNHREFVKARKLKNQKYSFREGQLQWIDWMIENHTVFEGY